MTNRASIGIALALVACGAPGQTKTAPPANATRPGEHEPPDWATVVGILCTRVQQPWGTPPIALFGYRLAGATVRGGERFSQFVDGPYRQLREVPVHGHLHRIEIELAHADPGAVCRAIENNVHGLEAIPSDEIACAYQNDANEVQVVARDGGVWVACLG